MAGGTTVSSDDASYQAFVARLRERGFDPGDQTLQAIWGAVPALEQMRARLRRRFEHADEPAHVFTAQDDR